MKIFKWVLGLWLLVALGSIIYTVVSSMPSAPEPNTVLEIDLSVPLSEQMAAGPLEAITGDFPLTVHEVTLAMHEAARDPSVVGLFLNIGNPKMGIAHLQEVSHAIDVFRESGKWSVAYLETAGEFSSGNLAYALAACADHIFLAPPGAINLVGLRAEVPFFAGTLDWLDIDVLVEKRHEYKNAADSFAEYKMSDAMREATAALLGDIEGDLIVHYAARRGVPEPKAREWVHGGPYNAAKALELKLIDELGYLDQALTHIDQKSARPDSRISLNDYLIALDEPDTEGELAVIIAEGQIMRGTSSQDPVSGDTTLGSTTLIRALREARDDAVQGVLLRVNSPGGSYVASDLVRREVELTRKAGIPVVVSMANVAASGGYFISLDADYIFALPGSITGSIGVISAFFSITRSLEKNLHMNFDSYGTSDNASYFSGLELPSGKRLDAYRQDMDAIYADFTGKVAQGRNLPPDQVAQIAKGRVWSGKSALEHGLVDELGGMRTALRKLKELSGLNPDIAANMTLYPEPDTPWDVLKQLLHGAQSPKLGVGGAIRALVERAEGLNESMLLQARIPTIQ